MRAVKSKVSKGLPIGANLEVVDNSGAKLLRIITVKSYKTRTKKLMAAGVADLVTGAVKIGDPDMRHKVVQAVVIRQKKEFTRPEGMKMKFEDNAAIIITSEGEMRGSEIRGPVAREAAERWSRIASASSIII